MRTAALAFALLAAAAAGEAEQRVDLSGGSAVLSGRIQGDGSTDYVLALPPGATLSVLMEASNASANFNLLAPGSGDEAYFIGSVEGAAYRGEVAAAGDHRMRVYLMRNAARRDEAAAYRIAVALSGPGGFADGEAGGPDFWRVAGLSEGGSVNLRAAASTEAPVVMRFSNGAVLRNLGCATNAEGRWCEVERPDAPADRGFIFGRYLRESAAPPPGDAKVGDTDFDAVGALRCDLDEGCPFGVVRQGGGDAVIRIEGAGGKTRIIRFRTGAPVAVEDGAAFNASREGDATIIEIGTERYEIPDAAVTGG